jgi:ketol-acid reductoisomerase
MTGVRYDAGTDADLSLIQSRTVAVIGGGTARGTGTGEGLAHALNLRDCGVDVRMGLPDEAANAVAAASDEGLPVLGPAQAAAEADVVVLLAPDTVYRRHFDADIAPNLRDGDALIVGRGLNIRYGLVQPPPTVDVALVAPKGPGELVRRQFVDGKGVPCLVAVHADASGDAWPLVLSYTKAIGGTRAGVIPTTFAEQTEAELFGEQAVLGGLVSLVEAGFDVLTEAGYAPEVAYFACVHELKARVDLMYEGGLERLLAALPGTTRQGAVAGGPRVVTPAVRAELHKMLTEIADGTFAREWLAGTDAAQPPEANPRLEEVGRNLRGLMPWLESPAGR